MTIVKIIVCAGVMLCNNGAKKVSVQISTTQTSSYCGGIMPDDKLVEELRTPKPWMADLYLYPAKGKHSPTVLPNGKTIDLNPGTYLLSPRSNLSATEVAAVINKKETAGGPNDPYINAKVIEVSKDSSKQSYSYNFHNFCAHELDPNISPPPSSKPRDN